MERGSAFRSPLYETATMSTLEDKLKSLGVKLGARELPPPQPRQEVYAVEQVLPGRFWATPHGEAFVVETAYAPDHRHGQTELQLTASRHIVAEWAGDPRIATVAPSALAFLDTETTGLAGGTGTYAFLIGVGRFEADRFRLAQFFMRDPTEEPAQLAALTEFLQGSEVLVTFNGKASADGATVAMRGSLAHSATMCRDAVNCSSVWPCR